MSHYLRTQISQLQLTQTRPLRDDELQVLRAQYEKEGDMVGVQTKFNYAWVCTLVSDDKDRILSGRHTLTLSLRKGSREVQL